jgi:uncharacterized protein with PIN domain
VNDLTYNIDDGNANFLTSACIKDLNSKVSRCPNCNSAVVVQEDAQNKSIYEPKQPVIAEAQRPPTHQKQSELNQLSPLICNSSKNQ